MVSPSSRRRAAKYLVEEGLANAAQARRALGLARSSYYLVGQKRQSSQKLERKIIALSEEHPRYGYRRITALMRRKGKSINAKRVQRVRRQAGLQVIERQKRARRLGPTMVRRLRAERANQSSIPARMLRRMPWNVLPICMSPKPSKSANKVDTVARCVLCISRPIGNGVSFQTR
jgi:transposase InsO family protein